MRTSHRRAIVLLCVAIAAASAARAGFDESLELAGDTLVLRNLIGEVEIVGHDGSSFEVEIHVQGPDATAGRVRIERTEGPSAEVAIRFPLEESKHFVYPRLGGDVSISLDDGGSWLAKLFGGGRVHVASHGSGLEVWADATVRVPRGKRIVVDHGVGRVVAADVDADVDLSTRSGSIDVRDARGSIVLDTGSGSVTAERVDGDLDVDTGSGRVSLADVRGGRVHVDTGSGAVEADHIGADEMLIDTGSGSVRLALDRMGPGRFVVDTGSGGIELALPADASAEVRADTGSGGIRIDLPEGYRVHKQDRDEAELTVGEGAAEVVLDTGSGEIHISQ